MHATGKGDIQMKKDNNIKSNRRSFFAAAGTSIFVATILKAVPFSGMFTKNIAENSSKKLDVKIHPHAVKRNNGGLS